MAVIPKNVGGAADNDQIYVCSPYKADTIEEREANEKLAEDVCRALYLQDWFPVAPHLYFPRFLDDSNDRERRSAMCYNEMLIEDSYEVWVIGDRITEGMKAEICHASYNGIRIRFIPTKDIYDTLKYHAKEEKDIDED